MNTKNITHYHLEKEQGTQLKNNLEKEFSDYLTTLSGKLIHAEDLQSLQEIIKSKANELNIKHSRCKALEVSFSKNYKENIRLYGVWAINFYIKPVELVHISSISYRSISNN